QAIRLNRGLPESWFWRGALNARKASRLGPAIEDAEAALQHKPQPEDASKRLGIAQLQRAGHLLLLGRDPPEELRKAGEFLDEAGRRNPGSFEILVWKGILCIRKAEGMAPGDAAARAEYGRAEQEFTRSLGLKPD